MTCPASGGSSNPHRHKMSGSYFPGGVILTHHRDIKSLSFLYCEKQGNYFRSNPVRVQSDIVMYRSKRVALPFARTASHDRSRWSERRARVGGTQHPDVNGKQGLASQLLALRLRSTSLYVELVTLSTVAILAQGTISG